MRLILSILIFVMLCVASDSEAVDTQRLEHITMREIANVATSSASHLRYVGVRNRTAQHLSISTGSIETKTGTVPWSPSSGEVILDYKRHERSKFGNTSYTVTHVPANYRFVTRQEIEDDYQMLIDTLGTSSSGLYGNRLEIERQRFIAWSSYVEASNDTIVVSYHVQGDGYPGGGGGGLVIDIDAKVARFPTSREFDSIFVASHLNRIRNPPATNVQDGDGLYLEYYRIRDWVIGWRVAGPDSHKREIHKVEWSYEHNG